MFTAPNQYAIGRLMEEDATWTYEAEDTVVTWLHKVKLDYIAVGTKEFTAMAPQKRNCYYPDEKVLEPFDVYSEANCVLLCAWHLAKDKCGRCVPWFLLEYFPNTQMCEANANRCFKNVVDGRYYIKNSTCINGCLPDCETVQYQIKVQRKNLPWQF